MRKIGLVIFWIFVVGLLLFLFRNPLVKAIIESTTHAVTGLPLKIGKLDLDFSKTYVAISDFKLFNPKNFQDPVMADLPEIFVDYNLSNIIHGKLHLEKIRVHLKELNVIRNQKGELNLNSIKTIQSQKTQNAGPKNKPEVKVMPIQIDFLSLKVEKATYKDYASRSVLSKVFPVNINEQFKDITSVNYLINLIILRVMLKTPIAALSGFDIQSLQDGLRNMAGSAAKFITSGVGTGADLVKTTGGNAQNIVKAVPEDLKNAAAEVKSKTKDLTSGIKGSLGNLKNKIKIS